MAKSKVKKTVRNNKRLQSIELQMVTYLKGRTMDAKSVKAAFDGIASQKTINSVAKQSDWLTFDDRTEEISSVHKADVTYNFSYQAGDHNIIVIIGGKTGKTGQDIILKGVDLKGAGYTMNIEVVVKQVGNWTLEIKKIAVLDIGDQHNRVLSGTNPIKKNESWKSTIDTKRS